MAAKIAETGILIFFGKYVKRKRMIIPNPNRSGPVAGPRTNAYLEN
jgi:hypothetical protein